MAKLLTAVAVVAWIVFAPIASADPGDGNNQSTTVLCRDADYADLHPTVCDGPFSLTPRGHGGAGGRGGLLGGILHAIGGLL